MSGKSSLFPFFAHRPSSSLPLSERRLEENSAFFRHFFRILFVLQKFHRRRPLIAILTKAVNRLLPSWTPAVRNSTTIRLSRRPLRNVGTLLFCIINNSKHTVHMVLLALLIYSNVCSDNCEDFTYFTFVMLNCSFFERV